MSKYIRVSEDDREYLTTYQEHCEEVAALQDDGYDFEGCILKQADTIEELCDEFVVIYNNGRINQFKANQMANEVETTNDFVKQSYLRFCKEIPNYEKVFGAIWTDKGLIYVAKMNEKGKLELL